MRGFPMSKLSEGDAAPDFSATTTDGRPIRLRDFVGQTGLVIFFYPKDGTRICTAEACAFRDSYALFTEAGFEVIGISGDSAESHSQFASEHQLPFPLIADQDGSLRRLFGVPRVLGLLPGRVTYVINSAGKICRIFSAAFASDEHVQQALEAIKSAPGGYVPA